jgi:hypothetical protein
MNIREAQPTLLEVRPLLPEAPTPSWSVVIALQRAESHHGRRRV